MKKNGLRNPKNTPRHATVHLVYGLIFYIIWGLIIYICGLNFIEGPNFYVQALK
jgi:hypothetical protein